MGVFLFLALLVNGESAKAACGTLTALYDPSTYTSGTTLTDQGGCNNAGTIIAGTPVATSLPARFRLNQIGSGQAFWLNAQQTNPTTYSIAVWFKTSAASGTKLMGYVQNTVSAEGGYDRHIYIGRDGKVYYGVYNNAPYIVNSTTTVNDGKWHLVVATQSGSTGKLYVDSVLAGTVSSIPAAFNGYWKIGGFRLTGWTDASGALSDGDWVGDVGKVYIYGSTQLSDADVLNLYNNSKSGYLNLNASLSAASGLIATHRTSTSIQLNSGADGKVTFYQGNKRIAGCINLNTNAGSATCSWMPTVKAATSIYARVAPSDSSLATLTTTPLQFQVKTRTSRR